MPVSMSIFCLHMSTLRNKGAIFITNRIPTNSPHLLKVYFSANDINLQIQYDIPSVACKNFYVFQ